MTRTALAAVAIVTGMGAFISAQVQQPPQGKPPISRDAVVAGPPQPAGTGVISGTLVATDSGRAVRRAQITLTGGDTRTSKSTTTDDRGGFAFNALPSGDFTLTASKGGYLTATFGQQKPGTGQAGTPIHLAAAQRVEKLSFPIMRGSVITGVITDEFGDPAFGTPVRAMRYSWRTGERSLQLAGTGTTDDRGVYRIPALTPGEYIVSAVPRDSQDAMAQQKMVVEEMAVAASRSGSAAALDDMKMMMAGVGAASDAPDPTSGYAPVYFPNTTQASSATTFTLGPGEERSAIDLQLQLVPLVTITGTVSASQPTTPASINIVDRSQPGGVNARSARSLPDGSFTIKGVVPGQYTLVARAALRDAGPPQPLDFAGRGDGAIAEMKMAMASAANANQLWGMTDVAVDGRSRPNVAVVLQAGMTVTGVVKFEGGNQPAPNQLPRVSIMLAPFGSLAADLSMPSMANLDGEGRFTIRAVFPGTYRVVASGMVPPGYSLKSAVFNTRDALDFGLDVKPGEDLSGAVTFGTGASEISGVLTDATGRAATGYTVVIFAADARYWTPQSRRILTTRPSTDGHYGFRNLPAGDYRLATVTDIEQGQWYDQALLRQLMGASVAIKIEDGDRKTQDLRIK